MHWSTELFIDIRELLETNEPSALPAVEQLFDELIDDFKGFLNTPARSESSRQTLQKGEITIDDTQYSVNEEFITVACTLAEELGIDELVCAQLVQHSSTERSLLGMPALQSGVAMFYVRRQHILQLVDYFLKSATEDSPLGTTCKKFVGKLNGLLQKTLDSMKVIEQQFVELDEKEKRGQFLGQMQNVEFVQILKQRREFLHLEHEYLGQILTGLVENKITPQDLINILTAAESQSAYNTLFIHYLPSIMVYSSTVDPTLTMTGFTTSQQDAKKVHAKLMQKKEWSLPYGRGAAELIFMSYYAGLCRQETLNVNFETDIIEPVRRAIDDGALELLMAIASDTGARRPVQYFDFRHIMQTRVPFVDIDLGDEFKSSLLSALERLVDSIISNLADILKEMRLSEEDSYLAMMENEKNDDQPGLDLERFFMFVSYLYSERPVAEQFWSDTESNLYGFIQWASQCHVAFMSATFCDMLASLAAGQESANAVHRMMSENISAKSKKAGKVTWEFIMKAFYYYSEQLRPVTAAPTSAAAHARVMLPVQDVPDLDDDTLIVLSSYFRLLAVVSRNDPTARDDLWGWEQDGQVIKLLFALLHTQTPLIGSVLDVISSFALTNNPDVLLKLWESLDNWAFNTIIYSPDGGVILPSMPAKDRLYNLFKSFNDVVGLVTLLESLMQVPNTDGLYTLPYPDDLGSKYRAPGVWPYVDFLVSEVFNSSSAVDFSFDDRLALQLPCLLFMKHSLELFDPEIARLSTAAGVNPDFAVKSQSFLNYLKVHPCAPTMTHLFNDKTYNLLISIASVGIDDLAERKSDDPLMQVVITSLQVINLVLDLQSVFIDIIVNEFKHGDNGPQFSTHGLRSFEDALLFNLPIVCHLALYASHQNLSLAHLSLRLLDRLASSPQFLTSTGSTLDSRIKKNRLLSAFETVDESIRIKTGFIEQLERDMDIYENETSEMDGVQLKLEILHFLTANLKSHSKEPTIAHFLLGFKVNSDGSLSLDEERGGINSEVSLLDSVLGLLKYAVSTIDAQSIELRTSELSSACSEIVLLLTQNNNSCLLVLEYLREYDFMLTSLQNEQVIDSRALWNGQQFGQTTEFLTSDSARTVVSFFTHRMAMLEYLSVETHVSADNGALSLVSRYLDSLVNLDIRRAFRSAKVLSFLDVLEFQTGDELQVEVPAVTVFGPQVVQHFYQHESEQDDDTAISELQYLLKLKGLEFVSQKKMESLDDSEYVRACRDIMETFQRARMSQRIRNVQLSCLMAWCKLVLVLVNDTEFTPIDRTTFILETFQTIVPKLVDYASWDVEFSEQLASLAVPLYKIYQTDVQQIGHDKVAEYDRTHALFKAALASMQTPLSTPELRADLYVVCYQYLKLCVKSPQLLKQNVQTIRGAGDKLLEIVCTDAISGEGVPRLTALVFLEVLCTISAATGSTFILDGLVRYNLLLLLVRSLQRIDSEIANRQNLNEAQLLYEINIFKATLCFLLQVAQTRQGANQLIQCGLFSTLQACQFLKIDADVGLNSSTKTFYELLIPVFQVISAILLSMGPENTPVIERVRQFIQGQQQQQLIASVFKKEVVQGSNDSKLQDLSKLFVLLMSLTE